MSSGILSSNPDPLLITQEPADLSRSQPAANPLSYYERYLMLQNALSEEGLGITDYSLVPFPINLPELYKHYVPLGGTFFLTIYDDWGRRKLELFQSLGESWEHLVPEGTAGLMKKWDIPGRLARLMSSERP